MSLYTKLITHLVFPLHEQLKKHTTVRVRQSMEKTQWLTPEELQSLQLAQLQNFLNDINVHVPYYRDLFKKVGFIPTHLKTLKDLNQLPFLDKSIIRTHTDNLKADDAFDLARFNTGGSSGEPLIFYIGKQRVSHDVAAKWRATRWWNVDIGDPEIVVWGSPIELGSQDKIRMFRDKLLRTTLLPAFEMSSAKLESFIKHIRTVRPKMLFGYPSALAHIAAHAEKKGDKMDNLGIKVAFVTSERLYDHQREQVSRVFGCPVANGYGGRDAGFIAHQCPAGNMHITAEDIIVEIIDADGRPVMPNEAGEIVITHLATRDFPFLRYRTGDIGVLSDQLCQCGRGLPVLKEIQGRSTDFIVAQNGTILHGLALIYVLRDLEGVDAFTILQKSLDNLIVNIVKTDAFIMTNEHKIISEFRKRLGPTVTVTIHYVDEIAKEKSGKFRYVKSEVDINQLHLE